jgi:outer membrane protein OmpA-like peptidoglycan-associated protein
MAPAPIMKTILISKPITIRGINFRVNSYRLSAQDEAAVRQAAMFAIKHPEALLEVKGYCSHTGSYAYNLKLSQQRAAAVAQRLQQMGVPASSIITKGYSWEDPVAPNSTKEGRYLNQRVTVDSTIHTSKQVPVE